MTLYRSVIISLLLAADFFLPSYAATSGDQPPPDRSITHYTLSNGLEVIVYEDHHAPMAFSEIHYRIGSYREHHGLTGISHLLEHMMFQGTTQHPGQAYNEAMTSIGAKINAYTTANETAYHAYFPHQHLDLIADYEADRMRHLTLDPDRISKEKQVVMEERYMRVEDQPVQRGIEALMQVIFARNGYSLPTSGYPDDIEKIESSNLQDWYDHWYQPSQAYWIVAGDVKPEEVLAIAKKHFGPITQQFNRPSPTETPWTPTPDITPAQLAGTVTIHMQGETQQPIVLLGYLVPSTFSAQPNHDLPWQIRALKSLLTGNRNAWLEQELIRKHPWASQVQTAYFDESWSNSLLLFALAPQPGVTNEQLLAAFDNALHRFMATPIDRDQLERIKTTMLAKSVYAQDSLIGRAEEIGRLHTFNLPLDWRNKKIDFIKGIKSIDVKNCAKLYLDTSKRVVVFIDPKPITPISTLTLPTAPPTDTSQP